MPLATIAVVLVRTLAPDLSLHSSMTALALQGFWWLLLL